MTRTISISFALLALVLAGCGGTSDLTCDEVQNYQKAYEGKRVETPDDLDDLEPLREIPLPRANPGEERPEGSPCLDLPPNVLGGT